MLETIVAADASVFDGVASGLTTNITGSTILEPITTLLPWIGVMVGIAFGVTLIRKMVKKISKGKAGF